MNRYWDFVDYLIIAGYAVAGIVAAATFMNGGTLEDVATRGFAVAGAVITLALVLSFVDGRLKDHYNSR